MKTNKSYTKRIRVTKKGKLIVRAKGQNHFNAKDSGSRTRAKRRQGSLTMSSKNRARFLPSR